MPQAGDAQSRGSGADALLTQLNRGAALHRQGKLAEAERIYRDILLQQANHFDALRLLGVIAFQTWHTERALELIEKAIALQPNHPEAHYNRGLALQRLKRPADALASFDRAIEVKPDFAAAYYNRGRVLNALKRQEEALASYDKAIALKADFARAYNDRGVTLNTLKRFDESLASYQKAISLKPDIPFLLSNVLTAKMAICDWHNFDDAVDQLVEKTQLGHKVSTPQLVLTVLDSPELQAKAAAIWTLTNHPFNNAVLTIAKRPKRKKIRLGYFSSDFYDHPTAQLMVGLFEKHDRSRFELIAFSFGPNANDEMRQRLSTAFDKFIDVRQHSDRGVAMLARRLEIDIAVDLNGYQKNSRTGIFAFRAAPIQVSYLAYPGTMAASYIDYLVADRTLIPTSSQMHFSEKIVYLPNSYQANDRKRRIGDKAFNRSEVGLPCSGFVFCCFNNNFKITPDVFNIWMRILMRVHGSVLWLLESNVIAAANLTMEARVRGINPERLVFAKRITLPDHLARHRLADLFLDTLPYNAHTTASDALWTTLPVLTRIGQTFAGRVAASLLTAIGLPELITATPQAYEDLAIDLAFNPNKLRAIKHKLANNRLATPLFDTELFTKHIEAAYIAAYERFHAGLLPDHIYVK